MHRKWIMVVVGQRLKWSQAPSDCRRVRKSAFDTSHNLDYARVRTCFYQYIASPLPTHALPSQRCCTSIHSCSRVSEARVTDIREMLNKQARPRSGKRGERKNPQCGITASRINTGHWQLLRPTIFAGPDFYSPSHDAARASYIQATSVPEGRDPLFAGPHVG